MREFLRHGVLVFAGLIGANALTYVYYATVTRAVGVAGAGLFTSLISAMLVLSLPAVVGANIVAKAAAEGVARNDRRVLHAMGVRIAGYTLPLAAATAVALLLWSDRIAAFFRTPDSTSMGIAAAGFVITAVLPLQRAVLQGAGAFGAFAGSSIIEGVLKAATGGAVLAFGGGLRAALGGYLIAVAASFAFNVAMTSREPAGGPRWTMRSARGSFVGIALPVASLNVMTFADVILVRHYLDADASGLYGAVALVGRALLTVIAFVPAVLLPKAAARAVSGESSAPFLGAAVAVTGAVVAVALAVVAVAPGTIIGVAAGASFRPAAPLLMPYAVAMSSLAGATVLATYLMAIGRRAFAWPLAATAAGEAVAITVHHPDAAAVLGIIVAGHGTALVCCLPDVVASMRRRQVPGPAATEVRPL